MFDGRARCATGLSAAVFALLASCAADGGTDASARRAAAFQTSGAGAVSGGVGAPGTLGPGSNPASGLLAAAGGSAISPQTGTGGSGNSTPFSMDACGTVNAAGLSDAEVKALIAGGAKGAMRSLYPYTGTVFPRGMLAPKLMWDGADGNAVYVHIQAKRFDYRG